MTTEEYYLTLRYAMSAFVWFSIVLIYLIKRHYDSKEQ